MKRINYVTSSLLVIGPIVLYPVFKPDMVGYFAACFFYAVAVAVAKVVIDDSELEK